MGVAEHIAMDKLSVGKFLHQTPGQAAFWAYSRPLDDLCELFVHEARKQ